jgi:hypothetical protein
MATAAAFQGGASTSTNFMHHDPVDEWRREVQNYAATKT